MIKALPAVLLLTVACAASSPPVEVAGGGTCNAAGLQELVGRAANPKLAAEAKRRSGAAIVRWLQPGQIVTMEFREDRLNIDVADGRVTRLRCG